MGVVVQLEVIHPQHRAVVLGGGGAPQDRTDPGHHFVEREGLGDVVVTSDGQTDDLVLGVITGREEQDGEVPSGGAELAGDGEPVHIRQHHVHHGQVGLFGLGGGQGITAIGSGDHVESGESQRG